MNAAPPTMPTLALIPAGISYFLALAYAPCLLVWGFCTTVELVHGLRSTCHQTRRALRNRAVIIRARRAADSARPCALFVGGTRPRPKAETWLVFAEERWRCAEPPEGDILEATAIALDSTRVLVLGGTKLLVDGEAARSWRCRSNAVRLYDAAADEWHKLPPLLKECTRPVVCLVDAARVIVVGGGSLCPMTGNATAEEVRLDGNGTQRRKLRPAIGCGISACAAMLGGELMLFGGENNRKACALNLQTEQWHSLSDLPCVRYGAIAGYVDNVLHIIGGVEDSEWNGVDDPHGYGTGSALRVHSDGGVVRYERVQNMIRLRDYLSGSPDLLTDGRSAESVTRLLALCVVPPALVRYSSKDEKSAKEWNGDGFTLTVAPGLCL